MAIIFDNHAPTQFNNYLVRYMQIFWSDRRSDSNDGR